MQSFFVLEIMPFQATSARCQHVSFFFELKNYKGSVNDFPLLITTYRVRSKHDAGKHTSCIKTPRKSLRARHIEHALNILIKY